MASRVVSATVGVPLVVGAIWAGAPWLSVLAALLAFLGALEFYRMAELRGGRPSQALGIGWTLAFIINGHLGDWPTFWVVLGGVLVTLSWHLRHFYAVLILFAKASVRQRSFRDSASDWAYTAFGALYVGWTLSLFLLLRAQFDGLQWVLVTVLGTFATDTGAFFVGRRFGRRPLAPTISPGKTWEGAIGGFMFGAGSVWAMTSLSGLPVTVWEGAILGVLVGTFAQVGDLVESKLKRASGVKDAGNLIPGHGGILDRLDSVVFVIVVVYHFSMWVVK